MNHHNRTWISGIGALTSLGNSFETISKNLFAGKSGIQKIDHFDVTNHPSQIAAIVKYIPCPEGFSEADFRRRPRLQQLMIYCCARALQDAGYWDTRDQLRIGLVMGNASECLWFWEDDSFIQGIDPPCAPENDHPSIVREVQQALHLKGPALTLSTACASGNFALAQAKRWLELGWVDICLAGGCDGGVTPLTLAGFGNLRALSRQNDNPQAASRPFDKDRDGFVLGEGGVMLVLEPSMRARKRSARVFGELVSCGLSSDAFHLVIPSSEPTQAIHAMRKALDEAKMNPSEVDYINAHGTSTPVGDAVEAKGIREVFGEDARRIPVSSTKSMTGHLLTAAAALEALACLATFEYGAIPPTINLDQIDPECDLRHVPHQAREQKSRVAFSNSFGFGGSNSCAIFRAV